MGRERRIARITGKCALEAPPRHSRDEGGTAGRAVVIAFVAGVCGVVVGLGAPAGALAKARPLKCKSGTVQAKVGARAAWRLPEARQAAGAEQHESDRRAGAGGAGIHAAQLHGALGQTREVLFAAVWALVGGCAGTAAKGPVRDDPQGYPADRQRTRGRDRHGGVGGLRCSRCVLDDYGSDPGGKTVKQSNSASIDGASVTLGIDSGGAHIGVSATVNGDIVHDEVRLRRVLLPRV